MTKWILLLLIDLLLFTFISFKTGWIGLCLILFKYIWETGLFSGIKFSTGNLKAAQIFYIEYIGEYYKISKEFEKLYLILNKFNVNKQVPIFSTFGIYYDDPKKVDPKKCRAVIGIIREEYTEGPELSPSTLSKHEDLAEYLITNKFKIGKIPETESLTASFPYINALSMTIGIKKFYTALDSGLRSEGFRKAYNIDRKKYKYSVEVYRNKTIEFYIPLRNHDRFNLHSVKEQTSTDQ